MRKIFSYTLLLSSVLFFTTPEQSFSKVENYKCDLWEDSEDVSHIRASDETNGIACFGFLHGRDRGWELDFFRRAFQGRRAEVLGAEFAEFDFGMRVLGLREKAHQIYAAMDSKTQRYLQAYSDGVNRGFEKSVHVSYEFQKLNYLPKPWLPEDSIGVILLQAFEQTYRTFENDKVEQERIKRWGDRAEKLFAEEGLPWETSILKTGEYKRRPTLRRPSKKLPQEKIIPLQENPLPIRQAIPSMGSNNWVVDGQHSETGNALMANDPHLGLGHPLFWYWSHIQAGAWDVMGASLPGAPVIVSGTNRHVSWGLTDSFIKVGAYAFVPTEQIKDARKYRPVIWIKKGPIKFPYFFKTYSRTQEGYPVIPTKTPKGLSLILRWTGFDLGPKDFEALFGIMGSDSSNSLDQVLSQIGIPSWNFVFSDIYGKIGYRISGRVPKRFDPPPFGIPLKNISDLKSGLILNADEIPHVFAPARGFISTANNRQWPSDSLFQGGRSYTHGFRALRIEELLKQTPRHNVDTFRKTQCDVQVVDARFLAPALLKYLGNVTLSPFEKESRDLLAQWKFEGDTQCKACPIYRRWVDTIKADQFVNENALFRLLSDPNRILQNAVVSSFKVAVSELNILGGGRALKWGDIHHLYFDHIGGAKRFPNFNYLETPGDQFSVNPGKSQWNGKEYRHTEGASERLIVEMSNPPQVFKILPGPNKDIEKRNPRSPENNPWRSWLRCEQHRQHFPLDWASVSPQPLAF